MLVSATFVAALAFLVTPTAGMPSATAPTARADALGAFRNTSFPKLVHAEVINGLLWTVYDDESKPLLNATGHEPSRLERRCGSNNIICDYVGFRANSALCGIIVDYLGSSYAVNVGVATYTDQCLTSEELGDNNRCCVSWSMRVSGLTASMLWGAAAPMRSQCSRDNLVSARATDVLLASTCAVQCLSNRPDGCS